MNEKKNKMILDLMRKIHQLEYAHRYQSIYYARAEKWLGISAFFITTFVAFSSKFPKVDDDFYQKLPFFFKQGYFVPIASTIAAILTGLLTFLKPSEKAETHKRAGSGYEKLRHRIELILTSEMKNADLDIKLNNIKEEWDSLDALNVSCKNFSKGKAKVKSFNKYPKELDFLDDVAE